MHAAGTIFKEGKSDILPLSITSDYSKLFFAKLRIGFVSEYTTFSHVFDFLNFNERSKWNIDGTCSSLEQTEGFETSKKSP